MSARDILLDGGSPWGFRMHGGADVGQPLRISRVNPGSKAAQKGVREGDVISSINGQSTRSISNSDAHALLRNAGETLRLGLNEECTGSPKRRLHRNIQESKSESVRRSTTVTKTTTNGAADPNCNIKNSAKGEAHHGKQNGGLKENSTAAPDSKGLRRRRRSTSQQPSSKEESDATAAGDDGNKARRRRRSRGAANRRKCDGEQNTDTDTEKRNGSRNRRSSESRSSVERIRSDAEGHESKRVRRKSQSKTETKQEPQVEAPSKKSRRRQRKTEVELRQETEVREEKREVDVGHESEELEIACGKVQTHYEVNMEEGPLATDKIQAEDDIATEVPFVTEESLTEVPVKMDEIQTGVTLEVDDIRTEVPVKLDQVDTYAPVSMDDLQTEVPATLDEMQTEAVVDEVQTEVPVVIHEIQTEVAVTKEEVEKGVVITEKLGTEVPVITEEVETGVAVITEELETEVAVIREEVERWLAVITEGVETGVAVITEVERGVAVITEGVETEVPIRREEIETEVLVITERVDTGVAVITEEVETEVAVITEEVETGVAVITEEVERGLAVITEGVEVPVIREEVETEVPVITERVETGVAVITEGVETEVPIIREEVERGVYVITEGVETEVPVIREEVETGVAVITEEVETGIAVIAEKVETGVAVITEVETGVAVVTEKVETGVTIITEEVETGVAVITEKVKKEVPVTISCNSMAYRNDEVVDKHSIADMFSSCAKGESQTNASTLSGENDTSTYSVVLKLSENQSEEKGNSAITVNLKPSDITARKDATHGRKEKPIDLKSNQNERHAECTTAKNYSETEKSEDIKDTASEKVENSQAINKNISTQSEKTMGHILNNGNVLERFVNDKNKTGVLNHEVVGSISGNNETEGSFFINIIEEQDVVMETEEVWEEVQELAEAEDTSAHLQEVKLSAEDRELLDPSPLMEAAEEETLRRFLHTLNLADYSKEAVSARNGGAEELFATRRDKRRASLETYQGAYSQQRGLEVIVEENSSDYSDAEARPPRGWEEAIFIPETNEVVFLNDEDESSSSGQDSNRNSALYRTMAEVDVFSEDMENALERGDVRVELADTSDDEEVVQRSWKRERQDGVEIVYLDEDRQEADGEEDPDAPYENFEFPVAARNGDSSDGIYENVEFVSQRKSATASGYESCAVYENVEYLKREDEDEKSDDKGLLSVEEKEVSGYFISVEAIENDAVEPKPGNPDDLDVESITPTNRSRRESSSSDAGSHGTAFYCPGGLSPVSSDADVSSFTEDVENRTLRRSRKKPEAKRKHTVKTLKELSIDKVLSLQCGSDILSMLGIDAMRRFQHVNKPPLSGSLPDLSSVKPENNDTTGGGVAHQQRRPDAPPESLAGSQWLGMPTKEDPNLFVCLSPSQRQSYHQDSDPTPEEADNLLDLHRKFIQRRSYHETTPPPPPSRQFYGIRHCYVQHTLTSVDSKIGEEEEERRGCSRSRSSSRLLAILRAVSSDHDGNVEESRPPSSAASSPPPLPPPHANAMLRPSTICCDDLFHTGRPPKTPSWHTATLTTKDGEETNYKERLRVRSLSDWLQLVRCGATNRDDNGTRSVDSTPCISTQSSPGPIRRSKGPPSPESKEQNGVKEHQKLKQQILERRFSLPEKQLDQAYQPHVQVKTPVLPTSAREDERHEQQLKLLHQRQQERLRNQQLALREQQQQDRVPSKQNEGARKLFDADSYIISKQGDIAIINNETKSRPKSMPPPPPGGEFFRQQMYNEYMHKVAERAERRRQKVIRLSSAVPRDQEAAGKHSELLENEFMWRVRARMDKLGLKYEEERGEGDGEGGDPLPKHLQEFLVIANNEDSGVWSPSQKTSSSPIDPNLKDREVQEKKRREGDETPPVVWTPKSAGASPTSERKEFRPVNFESPKLQRKNRSTTSTPTPTKADSAQEQTTTTTFSSIFPPWQQPLSLQQQHSRDDSTVSVGSTIQSPTSEKSVASSTISSTIDRRLVQSQSAPASGLSALAAGGSTSTKLPRAQNPTITLLQKAREGQLPRGALYLDHKMNSKEADKAYISPNEILYSVRKEYESDGDGDQRKKMVDLAPRKFEGIGPMTKEGIPMVLRSEVKDANQAKWYKRMYDSLHRAGKDDDYITIRYKPRRGHYPYTAPGGYLSEPEPALYDSDIGYSAKYATLDRRRIKNKENDFTTSTLPRSRYVPHPASIKYATEVYKNQPGRIEDYEPGRSSISDKETKQWWDEVLDIFDGQASAEPKTPPTNKPFMTYALKESGYESDSTLVFKRRDENLQSQLSPAEQKIAYKTIQKGGEVPLQGLRKPAPERPKEPVYGPVPPRSYSPRERAPPESPHRYVESEVTIHYRSPVRSEAKEALSEEELARRQAEAMRRIYQEERRRKYLQELQDMHSRRHTDNFTPSQKSPIPLNRYDDILDDVRNKGKSRDRTPEPKLVARALYNFVGQTSRELSFRRGDIIFVRRQIDKNWYEGEHNAMVGLFPFNYVEIIPYDGIRTIPKRPSEGQARAKFNFIAQTHLELSLVKGELVVLTRRVDDNWFEGRIGNRKGIFPVSYVEILSEPGEKPVTPIGPPPSSKPITLPASHTVLMNGSGIKQSMGQHSYQPTSYFGPNKLTSAFTSSNPYATLPRQSQTMKQPLAPVNQTLHIDTHSEPVPYRALYNYRPQNEDELELCEGDTVYVMEKCDDGWYVGSSQRTSYFGTFPGNYVERI